MNTTVYHVTSLTKDGGARSAHTPNYEKAKVLFNRECDDDRVAFALLLEDDEEGAANGPAHMVNSYVAEGYGYAPSGHGKDEG